MTKKSDGLTFGGMDLGRWLESPAGAGWTIPALAERLGVSRAAVYQWIAGNNMPQGKTLAALEELTGGVVRASTMQRHVDAVRNATAEP